MSLNRFGLPHPGLTSIFAGLTFGAMIHIIAIFALPHMSTQNAWQSVARRIPVNTLQLLPLASPDGQVLPYMAPDVFYALCRFNLKDGPVSLRIPAIGPLWSISLYDQLSQNYYVVTGRDVRRDSLELLLNLPKSESGDVDPAATGIKAKSEIITVRVPAAEGLAVIRAPIEGVSSATRTDIDFRKMSCNLAE